MSSKKHFGLGKGLGSLIPESAGAEPGVARKENVFYVEVGMIEPNPDQPRTDFDEDSLADLARSIRKYGVLQPLLVSKVEEPSGRGLNVKYQLIAGERRWRASQMAGLPHVPVIIRDDLEPRVPSKRLELALIENLQRDDLNAMESAEAYARLAGDFGLSQKEIGDKVGKSREAVANTMRLLNLPKYIKDALRAGRITGTHARGLLSFSDAKKQEEMYNAIIAGGFSTKDVENVATSARAVVGRRKAKHNAKFDDLMKNLTERLQAPVLIRTAGSSGKAGQIVIRFSSVEELNGVVKRIVD
ncbi:MAG TPA: ParB/RepB/Spo0J family partition protein [Candidatus Paceibacterota bacterium]|nr:ParB/RepB/Spo0J family partition protein [Candidatus Paceibacterota bacterium]